MLTLILSSSLMIHSCFPKPNADETPPPVLWEPAEIHSVYDNCPKTKAIAAKYKNTAVFYYPILMMSNHFYAH